MYKSTLVCHNSIWQKVQGSKNPDLNPSPSTTHEPRFSHFQIEISAGDHPINSPHGSSPRESGRPFRKTFYRGGEKRRAPVGAVAGSCNELRVALGGSTRKVKGISHLIDLR